MRRALAVIALVAVALLPEHLVSRTAAQGVGPSSNAITQENARPGTLSWLVTHPTQHHEIEGYASTTSAAPGETVSFHVSTTSASYTVDVYRMGWYGGLGGRLVLSIPSEIGHQYPVPRPAPSTGLIQCAWPVAFHVTIPGDWVTGMYMVKLTGQDGHESYIPLVVRSPSIGGDILFIHAVATDEAYNAWGGKSLYGDTSYTDLESYGANRAVKVSFARPFNQGAGGGQYFYWEYAMTRFLERGGYNVDYVTDVDVHEHPEMLLHYRAILIVGHSEYWSLEMRQGLESAAAQGVNIGVFAGNSLYQQIRFESGLDGPDRTEVCYKSTKDPMFGVNNALVTEPWRASPPDLPEGQFLGAQFSGWNGDHPFPWVVADASSWIFAGTGLQNGQSVPGIVGYEWDSVYPVPGLPSDLTVLTASPVVAFDGTPGVSNSTIYVAPSGARVFDAGTINWALALDHPDLESVLRAPYNGYDDTPVTPIIQRVTSNILINFITQPSIPPPTPTTTPTMTPSPTATSTPTPSPTVTSTELPTDTPTSTPTPAPRPLLDSVSLAYRQVRPSGRQTISVLTLPRAHVVLTVYFPNGSRKHHGGHANARGHYRWQFQQPARVATRRNHIARVHVRVDLRGRGAAQALVLYTIR